MSPPEPGGGAGTLFGMLAPNHPYPSLSIWCGWKQKKKTAAMGGVGRRCGGRAPFSEAWEADGVREGSRLRCRFRAAERILAATARLLPVTLGRALPLLSLRLLPGPRQESGVHSDVLTLELGVRRRPTSQQGAERTRRTPFQQGRDRDEGLKTQPPEVRGSGTWKLTDEAWSLAGGVPVPTRPWGRAG